MPEGGIKLVDGKPVAGGMTLANQSNQTAGKVRTMDPFQIWKEFIAQIAQGDLPLERIRPCDPQFRHVLARFVATIRQSLLPEMLQATPDVYRVEDRLHFILPLGQERRTFTLTILEGQDRALHHVESILVDLRPPLNLPRSSFPDLPPDQKAWMIIPWDDYRRFLETIWQDRAQSAGGKLGISYEGEICYMRFSACSACSGSLVEAPGASHDGMIPVPAERA
jgi:hypothetical protein